MIYVVGSFVTYAAYVFIETFNKQHQYWHNIQQSEKYRVKNVCTVIYTLCATQQIIKLKHWTPVTHICASNLAVISSYNDLSPSRRQAIIWTTGGMLFIGSLGIHFNKNRKWNSYIFIQENEMG